VISRLPILTPTNLQPDEELVSVHHPGRDRSTIGMSTNVLMGEFVDEGDAELLYGPLQGNERILRYEKQVTLGVILKDAGLFPSRSAAKANGWDRRVYDGYSEHSVGKFHHLVAIWNPTARASHYPGEEFEDPITCVVGPDGREITSAGAEQ
jgi:hypothetical protein